MIISLYIENFVLIDRLELSLQGGFSVFTGETGAGKSIVVGALSLLLGERADLSQIGGHGPQCEIQAIFDVSNNRAAQQWLEEQGLQTDAAQAVNELELKRQINENGPSRLWLNGRPTTARSIRTLADHLVQIHGQHDQIRLLQPREQLRIVDAAGVEAHRLKALRECQQQHARLQKELAEIESSGAMGAEQLELLEYQLNELDELDLGADELDALHQELDQLTHAVELKQAIDHSLSDLADGDDNIEALLNSVMERLRKARGYDFSDITQMIDEARINLNEAHHELNQVQDHLSVDPERQNAVEKRLEQIFAAARKHKVTAEQLHAHHRALQAKRQQHDDNSNAREERQLALSECLHEYAELATQVHQQRVQAAQRLAERITELIRNIGLPDAAFRIDIEHSPHAPSAEGWDVASFQLCSNPGQSFTPLNKTASGGELSRVALAIEVSKKQRDQAQTFVFDEVDTGIGGGVAEMIGQLMHDLASDNQVLAVTHLPQVAGMADQHLRVSKQVDNHKNATSSQVHELDRSERIQELARMSGGQKITEATLAQAREFLRVG